MKHKNSPSALQRRFLEKVAPLWPALKGSLALVRKPCVRPHCRACARGQKHPNYLLAFNEKGRRRCLYVPQAMVAALEQALDNGRKIEQLLYAMGPALLAEHRLRHPARTGPAVKRRQTKKAPPKS